MAKLPVTTFPDREQAEAYYLAEIDKASPVTPASVVALREAKWQEAQKEQGPLLEAEAKALGCSIERVIVNITLAREAWCERMAAQEAARIKAKHRIRQADNPADMHRALTTYQAALEAALSCPEDP